MTSAPRISPNDIRPKRSGDVLLGEDWVSPDATVERLKEGRGGRSIVGLNRSPLARKIIVFNLTALVLLAVGVLFMNPFRDSLALQRQLGMVRQAELIASVYEAHLRTGNIGFDFRTPLQDIEIDPVLEVFVFDPTGQLLASRVGQGTGTLVTNPDQPTILTDFLEGVWDVVTVFFRQSRLDRTDTIDPADNARAAFEGARGGDVVTRGTRNGEGSIYFTVATPITVAGDLVGVVAITSDSQEIDRLVRYEREQILQMFVVALLVSLGLSLVLASTIAARVAWRRWAWLTVWRVARRCRAVWPAAAPSPGWASASGVIAPTTTESTTAWERRWVLRRYMLSSRRCVALSSIWCLRSRQSVAS